MRVVHCAGLDIAWEDRFVRQRCAWCGTILIDVDLATIQVAGDGSARYPTWEVGALVVVDDGVSWAATVGGDGNLAPEDACMRTDLLGPCDWDLEAYCWVDGCRQRASHHRFSGAIGGDEIVEVVCCDHARVTWAPPG